MAEQKSHLWTEVDYDADGKQISYIHLPHSVTRSAYGTLAIPLTVIKNGKGPTALLMAGNHGDEYEGQVTLCKRIRETDPADIKPDGGIEFKSIPARCRFRRAIHHADFHADLIDEDHHAIRP